MVRAGMWTVLAVAIAKMRRKKGRDLGEAILMFKVDI